MVKMERKPKFEHKPREERFGNLVSKPDEINKGQYMPWARFQKPGAVKEVTFHAESRREYLTGFRKRKTERSKVAKSAIVSKELREKRKEKRQNLRDLMTAYDARQQKMKEMQQGIELRTSDDDESTDDDEEENDVEKPIDQGTLEFFDQQSGSATTVEIQEMDIEDIHSVSVSSMTLPKLPEPEKPLGRKRKKEGKGRSRQKKKDKLQKSKRVKHKGGRGQ